jgi:hypothetical protein
MLSAIPAWARCRSSRLSIIIMRCFSCLVCELMPYGTTAGRAILHIENPDAKRA